MTLARAIATFSLILTTLGPASSLARAQGGSVDGIVYDSLRMQPLAGAIVQLVQRPPARDAYSATTDSLGHFSISGIHAGQYVTGFLHPLLDTLGVLEPYGSVTIAEGETAHVTLAIPSTAQLTSAICGPAKRGAAKDSTGTIVGHVYNARTHAPMAATAIVLVWQVLAFEGRQLRRESRQLHALTKEDGWFALCALDAGDYQLRAENGARATGFVDIALRGGEIVRSSLELGVDSAVGARVTGKVVARDGRVLEGANVVVDGASSTATTDARGAFALGGLPNGSRMIEARALGYEPVRVPIRPSLDEPTDVTIVMEKRVETLKPVTVFGKESPRSRDFTGFLERQHQGFGHFITREKIDRTQSPNMCDLLREVPGVGVTTDSNVGCDVSIRGVKSFSSCDLTVYMDGTKYVGTMRDFTRMISPREIAGIEVYSSATEPPQFPGGCGSLVVWTR